MNDFIFGTLATDELRQMRVQSLRKGVTHYHDRNPRDPLPHTPIRINLTVGPAHPCSRAWVYWTNDGSNPLGKNGISQCGYATPLSLVSEEWDTQLWGYIRHFSVEIPGQAEDTLLRYRLSSESLDGSEIFADNGTYYAAYIANDPTPEWARNAIIYQVFPDRFSPGKDRSWLSPSSPSGFYGGRLAGITDHLDHIAEMGFNTIWMTPIFTSPSHHGYDATNLFEIEPRLGTKADLRNLVDKAHALDIRILLDCVPNHISNQHAYFQSAHQNPDSPVREWFTFNHWPDDYETFFGVKELPQLNLRNPSARQHMLNAMRYWLDFGVDGFRVDYAIGPSPDFWAEFRRATRQAKPDCWTFGEVVDPPDIQRSFEGGLDGCLDFILLEAIRQTVAFDNWNARQLAEFLVRHQSYFPATFSRPSFLDNHDMNRFLWAAGNDKRRLKLAALLQFCLPGAPVVYYGTEVGLSQQRDVRQGNFGLPEESRLPMLWGDEQDISLMNFYKAIIHERTTSIALHEGELHILFANDSVLAMERRTGAEARLSVYNFSKSSTVLPLPVVVKQALIATESAVEFSSGSFVLPALSGGLYEIV